MKKCCMKYGVMVIGLIAITIFLAGQHILITEVNHDPSSNPELEWVEIHNPTASPYCLDGWYVDDGNYTSLTEGTWWIPNPTAEDDYILYPGGYVTFANNADSFLYKYGYEPDLAENVGSTNAIQVIENAGFNFNADGDQVYLRDNTDSIIDCMQWGTIYEDSTDAIYYPLSVYSGVTYIRNPQDAEGEELEGEVSEQLSEVWSTSNAGFEGPNTGGFNPDGVSGIIISELIHDPTSPSPADTVEIRCKIKTDTTLVFVYMIHSTDTLDTLDNFINPDTSSMSVINDTLYYDTIMPYPLSTRVKYYVSVGNVDGDTVTSPINAPADHREYIVSEGSDFYEVHFNKSVDNASAVQWFAVGNDSMDWHMAKYIGSATQSVDACLYDLDRQIVADSLISAHNKGVAVRFITDADNRTTTQTQQLESAGIPVIDDAFPNSYGGSNIMHNKFIVIDTQMTFSGSYNVTDNGTDKNANNSILIKDILIAENYTKEFVEMWGSETMTPDANNSKFGTSKTDNINHIYYIGDDTIEVYMSPSDGCASKMINAIQTADTSIYFCIYTFSRQDVADAMKDRYDNHGVFVRGVFDATAWNQTWSKSKDLRGDADAANPWDPPADVYVDSVDGVLLHHKYMLIDADNWASNPIVITGSYNWSAAAEDGNDENMLIIHSQYFADLFLQEFAARYHEAGGDTMFSVSNTAGINAVNLSISRDREDVIINYSVSDNNLSCIVIEHNDTVVHSNISTNGTFRHSNKGGGEYTIKGVRASGRETMLGKLSIDSWDNTLSVVSVNKLFGKNRLYKANIAGSDDIEVKLFNMAGRNIMTKSIESGIFILKEDIPAGIYQIVFTSQGNTVKEKIMKLR